MLGVINLVAVQITAAPDAGMMNLANWLGNVIMPIFGALVLAFGILKHSKGESIERCFTGVMVCISISALNALAQYFVTHNASVNVGSTTAADTYANTLLNIANWVGNVILPVYAGIEVVRGGIAFVELSPMRTDLNPAKHFMTAGMCVSVSAIMRLLEYFVAKGQAVGS
jgi:hypothetical protein